MLVLGLRDGHCYGYSTVRVGPSDTPHIMSLFNSNNVVTSAALVEVCALLSDILVENVMSVRYSISLKRSQVILYIHKRRCV